MYTLLQTYRQGEAAARIHAGGRWRVRERGLVDMQGYHPQGQNLKKRISVGRDDSPFGVVAQNVDSGARRKSRDQKPVLLIRLCDFSLFIC